MANSSALTSCLDNRVSNPNGNPVWEVVLTFTVEAGGGSSEITYSQPRNGILQKVIVAVGAAGGITGTVNVAIDDNGDNEIFAVTSLAESTTYIYDMHEPVSGTLDIGVNPSDDPTSGQADWTIIVTLRGI